MIIVARKKPYQSNQSSGMLNNFSISGKDADQKSSTINDETDKERELKVSHSFIPQTMNNEPPFLHACSMVIYEIHACKKGWPIIEALTVVFCFNVFHCRLFRSKFNVYIDK